MSKVSATHFLRTAVVDGAGRRLSSLWQIWSVDNEVYISVKGLTDQFKSSLHSSGKYRHAFVSQEASDQHRPVGADRAVLKWKPGLVKQNPLLFQILIPDAGLGGNIPKSNAAVCQSTVTFPRPQENELVVLSIYKIPDLSRAHIDQGTVVVDSWSIPAGETICVTKHVDVQSTADITTWLDLIEQHEIFGEPAGASIDQHGPFDLRGYLLLDLGDDVGRVLDFGVREFAMWATFARAHRS